MLRRCLSAALVMFVLTGFVVAETYTGLITKIDKDKVTFKYRKKGDKKGEDKELKIATGAKFQKKAKDETTDVSVSDIEKAIDSAKGKVKGVFAKIETEGEGDSEKVTKITLGVGGKKKKDKE